MVFFPDGLCIGDTELTYIGSCRYSNLKNQCMKELVCTYVWKNHMFSSHSSVIYVVWLLLTMSVDGFFSSTNSSSTFSLSTAGLPIFSAKRNYSESLVIFDTSSSLLNEQNNLNGFDYGAGFWDNIQFNAQNKEDDDNDTISTIQEQFDDYNKKTAMEADISKVNVDDGNDDNDEDDMILDVWQEITNKDGITFQVWYDGASMCAVSYWDLFPKEVQELILKMKHEMEIVDDMIYNRKENILLVKATLHNMFVHNPMYFGTVFEKCMQQLLQDKTYKNLGLFKVLY